jgi:hypothetical protein
MKIRPILTIRDASSGSHPFAITPYLIGAFFSHGKMTIFGLGICWGYYSATISIGINVPKHLKSFNVIKE